MDERDVIEVDPTSQEADESSIPSELWWGIALLVLGLFFGVGFGGPTGFLGWGTFLLGGLTVTAVAAQHYKLGFLRTVTMDEVIDQWSVLIPEAQEHEEQLLETVANRIRASEAPNVRLQRQDVAPSWVRGVLGGRRSFLIVSDRDHPRLKPFRMYVNARPYGRNLQANWYLLQQPEIGEVMVKLSLYIPFWNLMMLPFIWLVRSSNANRAGTLELDFFDQQDLSAYVSNAHHCLLAAVDQLMVELSQDPSRIDRKSRGFLGVS